MLKKIFALGVLIVMVLSFTACGIDLTFEGRCKTTEDGFVYYEDKEIGLCIISLPDNEEVVIPEYIDGKRVMQLGYEQVGIAVRRTHRVDGTKVKKLTIQHTLDYYAVSFPVLDYLLYVDYPYCKANGSSGVVIISDGVGVGPYVATPNVELITSNRNLDFSNFKFEIIEIPSYVTKIEEGVFKNLTNITIKVAIDEKPIGWEDGWNGNCPVEWGVEI